MKCVLAVGALPAPLTPLLASATMPWLRSTRPAATSGLSGENHGSGVAAGIGNEARAGDLFAMQLRHAVDGLRLRGRGQLRAVVLKGVDCAIGRFDKPPCAAQVDDAHAAQQRFGHPLARLLVRRGQEQDLNAAAGEQIPGKGLLFQRCRSGGARQAGDEFRPSGTPPRAASAASTRPAKTGGAPLRRGWRSNRRANSAPA